MVSTFIPAVAAAMVGSPSIGDDVIKYGMTMWFKVEVETGQGTTPLGEWSSCSGLGVEIGSTVVKEGFRHADQQLAPDAVKYGDITLERGISARDSRRVRQWLGQVVQDWMLADDGAAPGAGSRYRGVDVTIQLFGAPQGVLKLPGIPIATWNLRNAYPKSWTGPSLDASSGSIATEKLTLTHNGFLPTGRAAARIGQHRSGAGATGEPGLLSLVDTKKKALELQYQPSSIVMKKEDVHKSGDAAGTITDPGKIGFEFTVQLEGVSAIGKARKQLFTWINKNRVTLVGKTELREYETLELRIGKGREGIDMKVWLRSVTTTFTRFTMDGTPSRATFKLSVEEVMASTSTTPGGTPETTPVNSDTGRDAAAANNVEDPLRTGWVSAR